MAGLLRGDLAGSHFAGPGELGGRLLAAHGQGWFKQHDFLQLQPLSQGRHIVDHRGRKNLGHEPRPGEGVAVQKNEQGMKVTLLQAGRKKKTQIQARSQTVPQNLLWRAHFLALLLETGRRQGIIESEGANSLPNGGQYFPDTALAASIVSGERGFFSGAQEQVGCLFENPFHSRIIRPHKSRSQFWILRNATPLVARQEFHRLHLADQNRIAVRNGEGHLPFFGFGKAEELAAIQGKVEIGDATALPWAYFAELPSALLKERGLGMDGQSQIFP